jgi:hypothetical protein
MAAKATSEGMKNPLKGWDVDRAAIRTIGHDPQRPECILTERDGTAARNILGGTLAPWTASVTCGGPDLRTVYVGSLRDTTIPYCRAPAAGLPMVHWSEQHA